MEEKVKIFFITFNVIKLKIEKAEVWSCAYNSCPELCSRDCATSQQPMMKVKHKIVIIIIVIVLLRVDLVTNTQGRGY